MTPCSYCGRENEDTAIQCHECGTDLRPPAASTSPTLSPRTLRILARLGPLSLAIASVIIMVGVSSRPGYPLSIVLFMGSPLIFGAGIWIVSIWFRAELRQIEKVLTGGVLFLSLTFLGWASVIDIFFLAIGGMGPP